MKQPPYPAPDFSLPNQAGDIVSLSDFDGKWLVLYVYPRDDTPGCTVEACSMRDNHTELIAHGIQVVGVSRDSTDSHSTFAQKHDLKFDLLADVDGTTIKSYGAWGKKMFGKEGIQRKTFVINPSGQVVKVYGRVTPVGHGEQVLSYIKNLQAQAGAYGAGSH